MSAFKPVCGVFVSGAGTVTSAAGLLASSANLNFLLNNKISFELMFIKSMLLFKYHINSRVIVLKLLKTIFAIITYYFYKT